jgi:hypothetical protein
MMYDRITSLIIEKSLDEVAGSVGSRRPGRWGDQSTDDDDDNPAYDDSIDKTYARVKNLLSPVGKAARAVGRGALRVATSKKARAVARGVGKLGVVPTERGIKRKLAKRAAAGTVNQIVKTLFGKKPVKQQGNIEFLRNLRKKKQQQDDES